MLIFQVKLCTKYYIKPGAIVSTDSLFFCAAGKEPSIEMEVLYKLFFIVPQIAIHSAINLCSLI